MSNLGVYVDFRGELVRESPDWMERDFCRRNLTMIFLYLRQYLPKDVVKMIGKMVERDYKMDPVWEFLIDEKRKLDTFSLAFFVDNPKQYEVAYEFLRTKDFGFGYPIPNKEEMIWFAFVDYYPRTVKTIVFNKYKN